MRGVHCAAKIFDGRSSNAEFFSDLQAYFTEVFVDLQQITVERFVD